MPNPNLKKSIFSVFIGFFLFNSLVSADSTPAFIEQKSDPVSCGFPNWDTSNSMDSWIGSTQKDLFNKFGPPDSKDSDGQSGQYYLYKKRHSLKEEFYLNSNGIIYSWQWQAETSNDNMDDFVSLVKKLAYGNSCGDLVIPADIQYAAEAAATGDGITLRSDPQFDPHYLYILGTWYSKGLHVPKDTKKAFQLFLIAATFKDDSAQDNLGDYYRYGIEVKKDLKRALYWYGLSAEDGNDDAGNNLIQLDALIPPTISKAPASK